LPDVQNNNEYNSKLEYLTNDNVLINKKYYPINSFLEELNKEENIDKIWDKIDTKFISYYSTYT